MLGSALPATATLQTSTPNATPTSPTRSSRLRGLSYLRNYTHNHLHSGSSRENTPSLPRSRSSNTLISNSSSRAEDSSRRGQGQREGQSEGIQSNENGWLPTVQGRSGLSRDSLNPASTTEPASPERSTSGVGMNRNRASTAALGPTPAELRGATMRRSSRLGALASLDSATSPATNTPASQSAPEKSAGESDMPSIRFIPHLDRSHQRPSLNFTAVSRTLSSASSVVRVGRYSERDQTNSSALWADGPSAIAPVGFKSKVVSRKHCEFWQSNGQWYVKDVKSSSGTFLNHVRLSGPGMESRPFPVSDGDLVQLGIDFKGGEEVIFRCVKIRIEINRGWQKSLNSFNTSEYKKIVNRTKPPKKSAKARDSDAASTNSSECSICLNPVAPCQALFVAPCSHVWHFKCIRNLINGANFPNFLCPNCRFSADLEADVEPPEDYEDDFEDDGDMVLDEDDERGGVGVSDVEEEESDARVVGIGIDNTGSVEVNNTSYVQVNPMGPSTSNGQNEERPVQLPQPSQSLPIKARSTRSTPQETSPRATTPTSDTQFALAAGVINMRSTQQDENSDEDQADAREHTVGPMTPRNDAGPFVLDGGGETHAVDASHALQREVTQVPVDERDEFQ